MDGFKNTTKTSYDTASGRKFANGGMTVSRADMPGGEGPMNKPAMVAKYAKGGSVKKAEQKIGRVMTEFTEGKLHSGSKEGPKVKSTKQAVAIALNEARAAGAKIPRVKKQRGGIIEEGVSTRPVDKYGRRMSNEELGMTPGGVERGASLTESERRALARRMFGASATKAEIKALRDKTSKGMSDLDRARMMVRPLPRKEGGGVPAHSDRPMIRRAMGGLSAMPKGGKC